jgi:transposase
MPTAATYQELYEHSLLEITALQEKLAVALAEINHLRRQLFGRSADNRTTTAQAEQSITPLDIGAPAEALQAIEEQTGQQVAQLQQAEKTAPKKREKNTRMAFPAELPRQEVIIHPTGDLSNYVQIGQEITEILEVSPASFWVKRIIRTKWALKSVAHQASDSASIGVLIAPIPSRTVAKGLFGESLLAQLVISKYVDHLPLHRQMKIFQRAGVQLAASTVSDNIASVCRLLEPLYSSLKREVLANAYLQADETSFRVQDGQKKGACHLGYQWAYHAPASKLRGRPAVLFDYQPGRGQEGPGKLLANFKGVLQTDGYVVYSSLFEKSERVTLAACMAHVRRKFDEAVYYDARRATYAVTQIARLYAIEQQIRDTSELDEPAICQKRHLEANPVLEELKAWLDTEYDNVLPSSPIGKAIAYALNLWERLTVYLYHGALQIDNNLIENSIRPIALGRKNFLFAGSHAAAQNAAMLYSFLGSCQRNNVPSQLWLSDVLTKLNDSEYEGRFSDLLPNRWKKL